MRLRRPLSKRALVRAACAATAALVALPATAYTAAAAGATPAARTSPIITASGRTPGVYYRTDYRSGPIHNSNHCSIACNLLYYGGQVQANTLNNVVVWGGNVLPAAVTQSASFYQHVGGTNYIAALSEYSTLGKNGQDGLPGSNQTITATSTYEGTRNITPSVCNTTAACTVVDSQIQAELKAQVAAGQLPTGQENRNFTVLFPPNVVVCQDAGMTQCSTNVFCAYHGTFQVAGVDWVYQVIPDEQNAGGGCGTNTYLNDLNSGLSHEFVETISDTEVGLASVVGRPLAWYDVNNGENGDPCNQIQTSLNLNGAIFTVQNWWSNAHNDCIAISGATTNFSISVSPPAQTVGAGSSVPYTVSTTVNGVAQSVNLSVSGLPTGVSGNFSPNPITAGAGSTLTLSAAANAPAANNVSFTVTGTGTTVTHTANAAVTVSTSSGGGVINGSFQAGNFTGWTTKGVDSLGTGGDTGDNFVAIVGKSSGPSRVSSISQTFTVTAGNGALHFWYWGFCHDPAKDYLTATVKDTTTGRTLTLKKTCQLSTSWTVATAAVVPGHTVVLTLTNRDDGDTGASSYSAFDAVSLAVSSTSANAAAAQGTMALAAGTAQAGSARAF